MSFEFGHAGSADGPDGGTWRAGAAGGSGTRGPIPPRRRLATQLIDSLASYRSSSRFRFPLMAVAQPVRWRTLYLTAMSAHQQHVETPLKARIQ